MEESNNQDGNEDSASRSEHDHGHLRNGQWEGAKQEKRCVVVAVARAAWSAIAAPVSSFVLVSSPLSVELCSPDHLVVGWISFPLHGLTTAGNVLLDDIPGLG